MIGSFAAAAAVSDLGDGRYGGHVADGWDVMGNAHGGYLLSVAARALTLATDRPDPVSVTAHYLRPGRPGPIGVDTEVLRVGRRFATARATLLAQGQPTIAVLGTFTDHSATSSNGDAQMADARMIDGGPPQLPPPADAVRAVPGNPFPPAFMAHLDLRLHPDDAGFFEGRRSGEARIRGWIRLPDDEPIDGVALLTIVDAFPPTVFNVDLPIAWVPTLELTAHVRARPAPGWLSAEVRTRFVSNGVLEVDGEYWDAEGELVAQSRQLALTPRPGA